MQLTEKQDLGDGLMIEFDAIAEGYWLTRAKAAVLITSKNMAMLELFIQGNEQAMREILAQGDD